MENNELLKQNGIKVDVDKAGFALALRMWRLRNCLTQKQVAERFGCSRFTIMKAECGKDVGWQTAYMLFARLSDELVKEGKGH